MKGNFKILMLSIQKVSLRHPHPLAHIWAQGTPKNHFEPRNEVSER